MAEEEGEITFEEQLALEKEEKSRQQEDAKSEKVKVWSFLFMLTWQDIS